MLLTIITLTKNDNRSFDRTLKSILDQEISHQIEWLVVDASKEDNQEYRKNKIDKLMDKKLYKVKHINMNKQKQNGIYFSMNYAKRIASGDNLIFINSGDEFYRYDTIQSFLSKITDFKTKKYIVFGQAQVVANKNLTWKFPGNNLTNPKRWLRFFTPNHQSMLISRELAEAFEFDINYGPVSDKYWKKNIIKNTSEIVYLDKPVCKFYLGGLSSKKPTYKILKELLLNKKISYLRKFVFIIKYILPTNLFNIYYLLQFIKSKIIDLIL